MRHLLRTSDGRCQRSLQQADEGASCQRSVPSVGKMEGVRSRIIQCDHSSDKAGRCTRSNFTTEPEPISFLTGRAYLTPAYPESNQSRKTLIFRLFLGSATISLAFMWNLPRACFLNDICKLSGSSSCYRKSPNNRWTVRGVAESTAHRQPQVLCKAWQQSAFPMPMPLTRPIGWRTSALMGGCVS